MLKGIETVVYYVEDVKAAGAWYRKVLGIEPNYDTEYYVGFTVAGDELGLHPREGSEHPGGQTAYWTVEDIDAAIAHFLAHGAKENGPVQDVGVRIGTVLDPFGNVVGLIQNPKSPNR